MKGSGGLHLVFFARLVRSTQYPQVFQNRA
jgi:hypothetical protein